MTRRAPTAEELAEIRGRAETYADYVNTRATAEATLALLDDYAAAMKCINDVRTIATDTADWVRVRVADIVRDFDRGRT